MTSRMVTKEQVSAGGVVFRRRAGGVEVALISVGAQARWQLPKGLVSRRETNEEAATREVREETGLETALVAPIESIEYWYVSTDRGVRVRFHKFVHFFLFRYVRGSVSRHDHEVNEARWVEIGEASGMLAFANEKRVVERARRMIEEADASEESDAAREA